MKKMKKLLLTICSFLFMLVLGVAFLPSGVKASAATAANANITYACIEYTANDGTGVPKSYTLVAGLATTKEYSTYVYVNGEKTVAKVNWGNFYIDPSAFECEVGETIILEIPAGTYYQEDAYIATDVKLFLSLTDSYTNPDHGAYNKQAVFDRMDASNVISDDSYTIQLNRKSWAINASNAANLYVSIIDPDNTIKSGVAKEDWANGAKYAPLGNAITVNGVAIKKNIQKVYADPSEDAYVQLANVSKPGDVLTFDGWFYNATYGAFRIDNVSFVYDGKSWDEANMGAYDMQVSTTSDANPQKGFYLSMSPNHIPVSTTDSGWTYSTVPAGTNHYGYYNATVAQIKLRKFSATDWYVALSETGITAVAGDIISFGGWYVCQSNYFIKINNVSYRFDGTKWTNVSPAISLSINDVEVEDDYLYVAPGQEVSELIATASNGNAVTANYLDAVKDGKFVLRSGESSSQYFVTYSVADDNGTIYRKQMTVHVGFEDFVMENGASIRASGDNVNGLRFTAEMSEETYNSLNKQNATFGMVIVPRDYITQGYELTAANLFGSSAKYSTTAVAGVSQSVRKMICIENIKPSDIDGDGRYEVRGAITDILTNNLTREFVAVAYACINGEYIVASYYGNDMENNARSIYYVAQRAIDAADHASAVQTKYIDTFNSYVESLGATYNVTYTVNYIKTRKGMTETETETFTAPLNSVVEIVAKEYDGFTLASFVSSYALKLYANKNNVFDFRYKDISLPDFESTAWHHPMLDATNDYMNDTNKAIAETMRDAGFTSVMLNGSHTVGDLYLNNPTNIEMMKNIINMFWTYGGIKTFVSSKNAGGTAEFVSLEDYKSLQEEMQLLAECEGFGAFFAWDEPLPTQASMDRLAEYAEWFDATYGADATFMVNLLPSYYDAWKSGDYTSYSAYVKAYCDIVLSNITEGTKYLSMDSYPINANGNLDQTFMYDMAILKHYAVEYGAQANAILQACGWNSTTHNKAPSEEEMRLMYYTALAFGMDSVGWWGYSPESDNPTVILPDQTAVDINNNTTATYDAIKSVNTEVATFGSLYKTYTWQGVIMSSPSNGFFGIGKDAQYDAFNKVKKDSLLSKYMLAAGNTSSFSAISGSGSNYVIGVMKDNNNNEAFTVVNYAAPTANKTLSLTFKANVSGDYIIYKNGAQTMVNIPASGYTLTLAPGEGAFIVSANTVHTVTFKNWDGSVLFETTCNIGATPVYNGVEPSKDGHTFTGWYPTLGAITGDTTYTATFKSLPTITFKNWDGTILQESLWAYGATPSYSGATPTKEGAQFIGWTPAISQVTGNATYTATFAKMYTVTYFNYDGTAATKSVEVVEGDTINYTPSLSNYIFKGWTLDGEAFDMSTPITKDITLKATWYINAGIATDSVISAEYVANNTQFERGYISNEGAKTNPNAGWYFDSDYNGNTGAGNTDENKLANWAQFNLTVDGGGGTVAEGRETYLVLPAINYKLYSKVDFAYKNNAGKIKSFTICGTEVAQFGGNNKLISIVTDANGTTKLYFREINSVKGDVTVGAEAVITLPESVANGSEGLRFNITVTGWMDFCITEMHATSMAFDYMSIMADTVSQLPATVEGLTYSDAEFALAREYLIYEKCMTEGDRVGYVQPAVILALQDYAYSMEIVITEAGSQNQFNAIENYRAFCKNIPAEWRDSVTHKAYLAMVNATINKNYSETTESILLNDPTVDTNNGAIDQNERIQTGWGGHHTAYNTVYETYTHMIQFTSKAYDGTVTLPAMNYNNMVEAYFGVFGIVAQPDGGNGEGIISINGATFTFDHRKAQYFKIVITGGMLIMSDDSKEGVYGGKMLMAVALPENVLNSTVGLTIGFNFNAWSQVEITEMRVVTFALSDTVYENVPNGWSTNGTRTGKFPTAYTSAKQKTFDANNAFKNTAVLPAFNYNNYEEVYFGIFAIAGARSWSPYDADNGVITINGVSYNGINPQKGDYFFKVTIRNGVLTMITEQIGTAASNVVVLTVALPATVLNGTTGLAIDFVFGGAWSQAEITEMHACNKIRSNERIAVLNNQATIAVSGTSINTQRYDKASYWGTGIKTDFQTATYESYNLVQFASASSVYTATFTMQKHNFTNYSESYFGFAAVTAEGTATVTINGKSYSFDLNDGYVYVKMVIKGNVLTVIGDGAKNLGQTLMSVTLSDNVLNGKEGLVITWQTAGWAQVELSEIQTITYGEPIL